MLPKKSFALSVFLFLTLLINSNAYASSKILCLVGLLACTVQGCASADPEQEQFRKVQSSLRGEVLGGKSEADEFPKVVQAYYQTLLENGRNLERDATVKLDNYGTQASITPLPEIKNILRRAEENYRTALIISELTFAVTYDETDRNWSWSKQALNDFERYVKGIDVPRTGAMIVLSPGIAAIALPIDLCTLSNKTCTAESFSLDSKLQEEPRVALARISQVWTDHRALQER